MAGAVKVHCVFLKAVVGRQVHAAAKPAHGCLAGVACGNHAHIHVNGRHVRVARVKHQRHAHGLKGRTCQLGPVLGGRGRQLRPAHVREATARALKNTPAFDDLRDAIALQQLARRLVPGINHRAGTLWPLYSFERADDARLQAHQILAHLRDGALGIEGRGHGFLMAR